MRRKINSILKFFGVERSRYNSERSFLQAMLILLFAFVYLLAWAAHIPIYVALGNMKAAWFVALLGIPSALFALSLIKMGRNTAAAVSANLGGVTVLLAITLATGSLYSPIPAWLFFGTMTTFLLLGPKAGWVMTTYILVALFFTYQNHQWQWIAESGFPFEINHPSFEIFITFVYTVSLISLSAVTTIYDYLQRLGFSELNVALQKVHEQHENTLAILDNIQQGIFTILPNGTAHSQHSPYLCKILDTELIANRDVFTIFIDRLKIDSKSKQTILKTLQNLFGSPTESFSAAHSSLPHVATLITSQNNTKEVEIDWYPLATTSTSIEKILVSVRDVSLIKKLQKESEMHQQERISQAKMAALGEMAGGVAHEINNPLAVIDGCVEIVLQDTQDIENLPPTVPANLAVAQKQITRISSIIKSLLGFARQNSTDELQPINIRTVVQDTLELTQEKSRKCNVHISILNTDKAAMFVLGDNSKIMQIVLNLVGNSIHALENNKELAKHIHIDWRSDSDNVVLSVHDNGCGIKDEIKDKVMQPFFTTKPIGKGTGLGLSLSKGLAEQMGGELYFESEPHNTTLYLKLKKQSV
jgi:signal transduction histidine kinase